MAVPAHSSTSPAPRRRRASNHRAPQTLCQSAASSAGTFVRGPQPLARRTSSWWTKNSLRFGTRRTHPLRNGPRGGPDRIVATSERKSVRASAVLRRSAKWPHAPGTTSPGPARGSCSRSTRCAARSRVVHGVRSVGASGPSSSSRSASCSRSIASKSGPATHGSIASAEPRSLMTISGIRHYRVCVPPFIWSVAAAFRPPNGCDQVHVRHGSVFRCGHDIEDCHFSSPRPAHTRTGPKIK